MITVCCSQNCASVNSERSDFKIEFEKDAKPKKGFYILSDIEMMELRKRLDVIQ